MRRTVALTIVALSVWVGGAMATAQDTSPDEPSAGASSAAAEGGTAVADAPVTPWSQQVPLDAGTYSVRLRDLEQQINELKEQIFRSKARLALLSETVLEGVVGGAQSVLVFQNRMSQSYLLVKATFALDGAPIFSRIDEEGDLGREQDFEIYNGSIVPGEHTLTVNLEYRGHGYGVFSYLRGYRFRVRSTYAFTVPEGRQATIQVVGYEKGGPTVPLEERPAVRYIERVERRSTPDASGEDTP